MTQRNDSKEIASLELSRRGFIIGGAALTFAIGQAGLVGPAFAASTPAAEGAASVSPSAWLSIGADETIRIIYPSTDLGQGSSTALPLILAEELDADWDKVVVEQLHRDDRFFGNPAFGGILYTAGSSGVYGYFTPLRLAGAQARRVMIDAAATHWSVPAERLITEPSMVVDPETGKRISYGALAALPLTAKVPVKEIDETGLKTKDQYRLIGKQIPRLDIPAKTRGEFEFGADVRVPDMVYALVVRAPVEGETVASVDATDALAIPRVLTTVDLPDGVAVIAETQEAALAAKFALSVTWTETAPARAFDSDVQLDEYSKAAADEASPAATWREEGDLVAALERADRVVEREYRSDYAYHAQFEPMGAVASVAPDGQSAEVWIASQTQSWSQRTVTETLGLEPDQVTMHMMPMGGSFGRRTELEQPYLRDALLTSKAVGKPVKVLWTREDDVKHGAFRPLAVQRMTAGLSADGALSGWRHRVAAPSVIAYFNPIRWSQVEPNDVISMRGAESKFYGLEHMRAEHIITPRGARLAPWRGIGAAYTSFAAEAFMDELAEEAGADPIEFRMALLKDNPRGRWLLERVAERSNWGRPVGETALGVSFAGYGDSMAAGVAEVGLDEATGTIRVTRFWGAVDGGLIIAPDNAVSQIEGGIVFGVSSSLKERLTIKGGEVQENNFYDYSVLRLNEVPEIFVDLADVDAPPAPIGEASTPMVAAALANGFYALTGRRLRHLPFTPDRVQEAMA